MWFQLAEHIPLKQGLRPPWISTLKSFLYLAEHIPLKQGLRHCFPSVVITLHFPRRAYSIKTRIKTPQECFQEVGKILAEHIPLKQGLRQSNLITIISLD